MNNLEMIKVAAYNFELEKIAKEYDGLVRVDEKKKDVIRQMRGVNRDIDRDINQSTGVGAGIGAGVGGLLAAGGAMRRAGKKSLLENLMGIERKNKKLTGRTALLIGGTAIGGTALSALLGTALGNSGAKKNNLASAGFRINHGKIYASDKAIKDFNLARKE